MPWRYLIDRGIRCLLLLSAVVSIVIVLLIALFILHESLPAWREVGIIPLLTGQSWRPQSDQMGLLPMILGSLLATVGALALGVPRPCAEHDPHQRGNHLPIEAVDGKARELRELWN